MTQDRPGPHLSEDTADIVDLMLETGCRIGEVLAPPWSDIDLSRHPPTLAIRDTIKTEPAKGTYRKATLKSDASVRTSRSPHSPLSSFTGDEPSNREPTRRRLRHPERDLAPSRQRRAPMARHRRDTGCEWVTPHTFRKSVATYISEAAGTEEASRQLGHSSTQITAEVVSGDGDRGASEPPVAWWGLGSGARTEPRLELKPFASPRRNAHTTSVPGSSTVSKR
jgi:integrase